MFLDCFLNCNAEFEQFDRLHSRLVGQISSLSYKLRLTGSPTVLVYPYCGFVLTEIIVVLQST